MIGYMNKPRILIFILAAMCFAALPSYAAEDGSPYDDIEQFIDQGNYGRAHDLLQERLAVNARDIVALSMLGDLYRIEGNRNKAFEFLKKASAVEANYPEPYFIMAKIYMAMQKFDEAKAQFKIFKDKMKPLLASEGSLKGYYLRALHYMASEYLIMKQYGEFRAEADEILRVNPNDQTAYYNLGVYHYQFKHDRASAFKAFDTAIKLDPWTPEAKKAKYAIEFIRTNPDSRVAPDFSFIDREYRD